MKALSRNALLIVAGITMAADLLHAQTRTSVSVDATIGAASGKGGEFFDRNLGGARIAAGVRHWGTNPVGIFGELAMDFVGVSMGHHAVCFPNPRGGCKDPYPEFFGPVATIGAIGRTASDRLEGRVGVGGAAYLADGTRVGAVVSHLDATLFPLTHIGLIAGGRWIVVPRYRGDRLSIVPWMIGIRVR